MAPSYPPRINLAKTKGEAGGNLKLSCTTRSLRKSAPKAQLKFPGAIKEILSDCKQGVGGKAMNCFNMKCRI